MHFLKKETLHLKTNISHLGRNSYLFNLSPKVNLFLHTERFSAWLECSQDRMLSDSCPALPAALPDCFSGLESAPWVVARLIPRTNCDPSCPLHTRLNTAAHALLCNIKSLVCGCRDVHRFSSCFILPQMLSVHAQQHSISHCNLFSKSKKDG